MSEVRPATKREERRYYRKLAREWTHARPWNTCTSFCWRCLWREYTGAVERSHRAHLERLNERRTKTPITYRKITDDMIERVFEIRHGRALGLFGQVVCDDDQHELALACGLACPKCRAAL